MTDKKENTWGIVIETAQTINTLLQNVSKSLLELNAKNTVKKEEHPVLHAAYNDCSNLLVDYQQKLTTIVNSVVVTLGDDMMKNINDTGDINVPVREDDYQVYLNIFSDLNAINTEINEQLLAELSTVTVGFIDLTE